MLISHDNETVICTPTKTGTESISKLMVDSGHFRYTLPKHGRAMVGSRRIMVVRDPYDRLRSMYLFGVAHGGRNGINFASTHCRCDQTGLWCGFEDFLIAHRDKMKAKDWVLNYTAIDELFRPHEFWRLEAINEFTKEFTDQPMPLKNVTASMKRWKAEPAAAEWTWRALEISSWFTEPDCSNFNYPVRSV